MPAQLKPRCLRRTQPRQRDQGLLRHLLLQPRDKNERRLIELRERRPSRHLGTTVRDQPRPRHRPPRRGSRHAADPQMACRPQPARSRLRSRHRSLPLHQQRLDQRHEAQGVSPQPQTPARRLRNRRRQRSSVVGRRQRQPRDRSGRPTGEPNTAGNHLRRARKWRHDRPPSPRRKRPRPGRHRAAHDPAAARASHRAQPHPTSTRYAKASSRRRRSPAAHPTM